MLPILTLNNLMEFNDSLFDDVQLPPGPDRDTLVYNILFHYGQMQVLTPDWSVMRHVIINWFQGHSLQIARLWADYSATYNPVFNKDGFVEEERTPNLHREATEQTTAQSSASQTENRGVSTSESGSTEQQYKGFQSSAFQGVSKEIPGRVVSESGQNRNTATGNASGSASRHESETGSERTVRHEYGNIGVTMASQMLRDDTSFWQNFSWYDVVAKLWALDNMIMLY